MLEVRAEVSLLVVVYVFQQFECKWRYAMRHLTSSGRSSVKFSIVLFHRSIPLVPGPWFWCFTKGRD
jgi:hypothetical protein